MGGRGFGINFTYHGARNAATPPPATPMPCEPVLRYSAPSLGKAEMFERFLGVAIAALLVCTPAWSHGGGFVVVPVYVGSAAPSLPPAKTGDYRHIRTVGLLSAIGESFTVQSHATGIFGHSKQFNIASWKMDDLAASVVRRYLAGRYVVKDVAFNRAALEAIPNWAWTDSSKNFRKFMTTVPADGLDAFLVIRPDLVRSIGQDSIPGLGLQAGQRPVEWLDFEIDVVDAHTLDVIASSFSRTQTREGTGAQIAGFVMPSDRNVGDDLTPTPAQLDLLQTDFAYHLEKTMIETLRALDLGVTLPTPGSRNLVAIPAAMNPWKTTKTVAIVSTVGDTLELPWSGALFTHGNHTVSISSWNLDAKIEADAASALGKNFSVKAVPFERAKLAGATFRVDKDKHPLPFEGLTPSPEVDAYIVIAKDPATIGPHADDVAGFGVWKQVGLGSESTDAFATYAIAVVDAHTLKFLAVAPGVASPRWPSATLMRRVGNADCTANALKLSEYGEKTVPLLLEDIMADSVPETLLRLGLTGMMAEKPEADAGSSSSAPPRNLTPPPAVTATK